MATVFMKWLETSPRDYDRGIELLTLGRIGHIKTIIADNYIHESTRVLEIGCGTGSLTLIMAQRGAIVTGIDSSPRMLAEAEKKIRKAHLDDRITLKYMDAAMIGNRLPATSFDLIVSTLVFSELPLQDQRFVLEACQKLLAPAGKLLIADEVVPAISIFGLLFHLIRLPLALLTWLITRTTTSALHDFHSILKQTGFYPNEAATFLGGSLVLYEADIAGTRKFETDIQTTVIGRLQHHVSLQTVLLDVWLLFFRIAPPYPAAKTGLYAVGHPDAASPVLVTGNFDLTVRRLVDAIDGKVNVWLLVADSAGINVWCAAGGGHFTAEKVIAAVKSSHLDQVVNHHALILPQLCANGVDGWRIRKETGWGVHWGPARASDIPAYLADKRKKTDEMRWVKYPLKDRLEMVTGTLGFYALLILLPVFIFWRELFWPITFSILGLSYFYAALLPWIPGRDGLHKSIPLTITSLAGLLVYTTFWNPMQAPHLFHWAVGLTGLSVFTAAELQGMSPLMRDGLANWEWETIIAVGLGAVYWLVPLAIGWR